MFLLGGLTRLLLVHNSLSTSYLENHVSFKFAKHVANHMVSFVGDSSTPFPPLVVLCFNVSYVFLFHH